MIATGELPPRYGIRDVKRRRLNSSEEVGRNTEPTFESSLSIHEVDEEDSKMDTSMTATECPCGYLHGPGDNNNHDFTAVGLSSNMMRGPS